MLKMKSYLLIGMMALVLAVLVVQSFQISAIRGQLTGNVVSASGGAIDTSGWTEDEKMNYDMHGIIPARVKGSADSSAGTGMVGGC